MDPRNDLLPDAALRLLEAAHVGRFGDVVARARGEGVEGGTRAGRGQRAEHDHRQVRVAGTQFAQGAEPVEDRHLDVKGHQVGLELLDLRQGDTAVGRRTNHPDLRVLGKSIGDQASDDNRVVNDQDRDHVAASPHRDDHRPVIRSPPISARWGTG
jgi:hypothetical protein